MVNDKIWPEPNACDVLDANVLARLQPLLKQWKQMLASKDVHSIEQQMLTLVWDDTIYRCFNEALRIGGKRPEIQRAAATIVELLHESFFLKQVMALRRLLEPPAARQARSVYSIPTLLSSIRKNHNLITRQNYVCLLSHFF